MVVLNIEDLFKLQTARIFNPDEIKLIRNVTIDSRDVKKGSLFIAIRGKNYDGHSFVRQAVKNGAAIALINRNKLAEFDDIDVPFVTVKNTTKALGEIAKIWRRKLNAVVIAVTGSSGKTSTKDIMAELLSEKYRVKKTESNNNNNIGVPLTILAANEKYDVLVVEVGTNHFGEVEYSAKILEPNNALITNIGNSHLEFLKNKRGVLKEKKALYDMAIANSGKIFINYDDPLLKNFSPMYKNRVTYGFDKRAEVSGRIKNYTSDGRPIVNIKYKNTIINTDLPLYGEQSANNYLAAISVALKLGLTKDQIKKGTKRLSVTGSRLKVNHKRNFILIDDTYNSNPDSARYAIELVHRVKTYSRKVLILGDMFELGKDKIKFHRSLSSVIKKNLINELYSIGPEMKVLYESLKNQKILIKHFRTRRSLEKFIRNFDPTNSVILVKGSRGMITIHLALIFSGS
ncbi:MAG: UDP-N-acetylmuramoyl-tripeptide--D-alanyl-D-alanine ligase [Ignavibacteriaceae bacterium]